MCFLIFYLWEVEHVVIAEPRTTRAKDQAVPNPACHPFPQDSLPQNCCGEVADGAPGAAEPTLQHSLDVPQPDLCSVLICCLPLPTHPLLLL